MHQNSNENLTLYPLVRWQQIQFSTAVQWKKKKNLTNDFIYLFNKSFFNLVEFPHLTHNGTTQIQEQEK